MLLWRTACLTCMHACRNGFTLHGLWPNLDNACPEDFPEHCIARNSSFEPLDMSSLSRTVLDGLKNNWISYTSCARTMRLVPVQAARFCTSVPAPCARLETAGISQPAAQLTHHAALAAQDCFLAHEWGCHGTCSGLSQEEYFATVLQLHADYNLLARCRCRLC